MHLVLGSDHGGLALKRAILHHLRERGHEAEDVGTHDEASTDYPDYAHVVARRVASGEAELGILVCGTGQGMAIAANKHAEVRAAVVSDTYSARMTRQHNDANVLCLGQRVVGTGLALDIVDCWLDAAFEGGRHARRVGKIPAG